jgi:hypothetical protein
LLPGAINRPSTAIEHRRRAPGRPAGPLRRVRLSVGLPGKSGVGGGIAPGRASIAVWSPGLDASGNSHLGRAALEALTKRMGWSIFGA